ncbi:helix-turn-helix domain-containing protein [Microtetraspora sp. AC03309]|uniref:helix-turn-helix domain-containing protein n=1 Tax=Microtetraspora sp. AC03309 TaxID=2779376 RepID=UPI001E3B49EA|nr:helix-turn-helix domain-containing protein [Microtetraspora sp. AC03309]
MDDQPVLGAVGIGDFDEQIYRSLLRHPDRTVTDLAGSLRVSAARVRHALARLAELGLLRRIRPGRYEPVAPEAALGWLINRRRLEAEAGLAEIRTTVADFAQLYQSGRLRADPAGLVEILSGEDAVKRQMTETNRSVTSEVLALDRPPYIGWPDNSVDSNESEVAGTRELIARGVDIRVVYCPESLRRPGRFETLLRLAEEGERSRFLPSLPFKLRIVDRRVALMPLVDGVYDNVALIRPSGLLDALIELFDAYWERGRPLTGTRPPVGDRPDEEDLLVLQMLKAGLKDETIARQLGVSARTATRRIAAVVERLGATTRFQAGAEASARGWI